jgi:hypothetical protein
MRGLAPIAIAALLTLCAAARADDDADAKHNALKVDTEHIFGFTEGGDKELEQETSARFGKRMGLYAASSTLFDFKYVPDFWSRPAC